MNPDKINERLDSVSDLIAYQHETDRFLNNVSKLPDLEKLLAKVFTYSIKHRVKAVYFEDVSLIKLREFRTLLMTLEDLPRLLQPLVSRVDEFKSLRLRSLLLTDKEQDGMFPHNLVHEVKQFNKLIKWKKVAGTDTDIPEPQPGLDPNFDDANL